MQDADAVDAEAMVQKTQARELKFEVDISDDRSMNSTVDTDCHGLLDVVAREIQNIPGQGLALKLGSNPAALAIPRQKRGPRKLEGEPGVPTVEVDVQDN